MGRNPKPLQPVKLTVEYVYVDPKEIEPAIRILAAMLRAVMSTDEPQKAAHGRAEVNATPRRPVSGIPSPSTAPHGVEKGNRGVDTRTDLQEFTSGNEIISLSPNREQSDRPIPRAGGV